MAKHPLYLLFAATLVTTMTACADESAPNRRGIERPLLFGGVQGVQNAEKRETETPKTKSGPTDNKEFPGQSRLESADRPVLMLDDVGTATTSAATNAADSNSATTTNVATTMPVSAAPKKRDGMRDEKQAYAVPGKKMVVPNTGGEVIPASWGEPVVLENYPHRPYMEKKVEYASGETLHNPYYYHFLFVYEYNPVRDSDTQAKLDTHDALGIPWFYGETLALPVLMVLKCPWSQQSTKWTSTDPLYLGGLPPAGNVMPAPYPGEIHYTYEFSLNRPTYDMAPTIPAPATPAPSK